MNNKRVLTVIGILALLLVPAYFIRSQSNPGLDEKALTQKALKSIKRNAKGLRRGDRPQLSPQDIESRAITEAKPKLKPTQTPDKSIPLRCVNRWEWIISLSNQELADLALRGGLDEDSDCAVFETEFASSRGREYDFEGCREKFNREDTHPDLIKHCLRRLEEFRSGAMVQIYRHVDIADTPSPALVARINKTFSGQNASGSYPELLALSEELVRKEPELYAAHTLKGSLQMISKSEGLGETVRDLEAFEESDFSRRELELYNAYHNDGYAGALLKAENILSVSPQSSNALYYKGLAEVDAGLVTEGLEDLEKAHAINGRDMRYEQALAALKKGHTDDLKPTGVITINFDSFKGVGSAN